MKNCIFLACILSIFFLAACHDVAHPQVETLYLKDGTAEVQKSEAVSKLYELYTSSNKEKEAYEVISKKEGRFILNYTPKLELLTLCIDPGSGWSNQYKNVSEQKLQRLAGGSYSFDSLVVIAANPVKYDSLLIINDSFIQVKTSGSPSL